LLGWAKTVIAQPTCATKERLVPIKTKCGVVAVGYCASFFARVATSGFAPRCAAFILVVLVGACGVADNQGACRAYVARVNQVHRQCGRDPPIVDADSQCPAFMNWGDVDCTDHYACVAEGYTCEPDGTVVVDDSVYDCAECR
jgi:hypothetical protein